MLVQDKKTGKTLLHCVLSIRSCCKLCHHNSRNTLINDFISRPYLMFPSPFSSSTDEPLSSSASSLSDVLIWSFRNAFSFRKRRFLRKNGQTMQERVKMGVRRLRDVRKHRCLFEDSTKRFCASLSKYVQNSLSFTYYPKISHEILQKIPCFLF